MPSGFQRSHPVWQDFYNSGERPPLFDIRILSRSSWRACFNGAHEQACVRRAGSRLWHAPTALAGRKCACVRACISCLRARVWWARAVLERANCARSNGIGVCRVPWSVRDRIFWVANPIDNLRAAVLRCAEQQGHRPSAGRSGSCTPAALPHGGLRCLAQAARGEQEPRRQSDVSARSNEGVIHGGRACCF